METIVKLAAAVAIVLINTKLLGRKPIWVEPSVVLTENGPHFRRGHYRFS